MIRVLMLFLGANVLFATGLIFHAFLYNFYLEALALPEDVMGNAAAALTAGGLLVLLPAGAVADRFGPRATLTASSLVLAAGLAAGALVTAPLAIYAAAIVAGSGSGLWRVAVGPVLMGCTDAASRSRAFAWNVGLLVAWGGIGMALAGSTSTWLESGGMTRLAALRVTLLGSAALSLLSVLAFRVAGSSAGPVAVPSGLRRAPREALLPVTLVALWMLGPAIAAPFFNIYFTRTFDRSIQWIGIGMGTVSLIWALAVIASGEVARRAGVRRMLAIVVLGFAPAMLGLTLAGSLQLAFGLYLLQGIISPVANPLIDQWLLGLVPEDRRGVVSSWRQMAADLSAMAGASLGGALIAGAGGGGFTLLFLCAGVVGLAGGGALALTAARRGGAA